MNFPNIPTGQALGALNSQYQSLAAQMPQRNGMPMQGAPSPAPSMGEMPFPGGGMPQSKGPMTVNPNGSTTYRFDDSGMRRNPALPHPPQPAGGMPNNGNAAQVLQRLQEMFAKREQPNPFLNGQMPTPPHPMQPGFAPNNMGIPAQQMPTGLPGGGGL